MSRRFADLAKPQHAISTGEAAAVAIAIVAVVVLVMLAVWVGAEILAR